MSDTSAPVLVTGFGAFPGQPDNPTARLVTALGDGPGVVAEVLPVAYRRATARLDDLLAAHPDAPVVSFGVAGTATGIRVERLARHRQASCNVPDVDGDAAVTTGTEDVVTRLPVDEMESALRSADVPFEPSDDAGDYVCNHLFHHLVTALGADRTGGFVHVPDVTTDGIDDEVLLTAGRIILEVVRCHVTDVVAAEGLRPVAVTWWESDVVPLVRWADDGRSYDLVDAADPANRLALARLRTTPEDPRVVAMALAEGLADCDFPPTNDRASATRVAATLRAARVDVDLHDD